MRTMVDGLRRELIQVMRHCKGITLDGKDINKILNGKFKEVINDNAKAPKVKKRIPVNLDEIAVAPAPLDEVDNPMN